MAQDIFNEEIMVTEWKPSIGRISLFPSPTATSPPLSPMALYRQLWERDPDSFQKQSNPLLPSVAQGTVGQLTATCSAIHNTRIDITLTPSSAPDEQQTSIPLIEDIEQFKTQLAIIVDRLAGSTLTVPIIRVALGLKFLSLRENLGDANKAVTDVIPSRYRLTLADEEDFILQINCPQVSERVADTKINFLMKWSVDKLQIVTIAVRADGGPLQVVSNLALANPQVANFIAASVEFDVNNPPKDVPLSRPQLSLLLTEALSATMKMQQELGLRIEGFEDAALSR